MDDSDDPLATLAATVVVTRPIITLDQVKHKAGEILEGRRHSITDVASSCNDAPNDASICNVVSNYNVSSSCNILSSCNVASNCDIASNCDENKINLSIVDETTLWQAAERTVTPMWEVTTTSHNDNNVGSKTSYLNDKNVTNKLSQVDNANFHFSNHDKISGSF